MTIYLSKLAMNNVRNYSVSRMAKNYGVTLKAE